MTTDDADRLEGVRDLIREAIAELEMADDSNLGWEPMVLLCAIERYVDKVMRAEQEMRRLAPVIEFSRERRGALKLEPAESLATARVQPPAEFMVSEFEVLR